MLAEMTNKIAYDYSDIDEAFPPVEPGQWPVGYRILFQLRSPKKKTAGGIILTDTVRETDQDNTQVAKVVAVGPTAFCHRDTGRPWIEGAWAKIGDFVRVPKFGGDRFLVVYKDHDGEDSQARFVIFRDADISAIVADPLSVRSYI